MKLPLTGFLKHVPVVFVAAALASSLSPALVAQTAPPTSSGPQNGRQRDSYQLSNFDKFLDEHPDMAKQIRQDPSLVNNPQFLASNPDLQNYLNDHPGVQSAIKNHPSGFLKHEARYNQASNFQSFMKDNPSIAQDLKKNPSLANNPQYLAQHPQLQTYLNNHPGTAEAIKNRPNAFFHHERQYNRHHEGGAHTTPPSN